MTTPTNPAPTVCGTIKARADLFRDALRFAYLAAGEGIEIDGLAPEDFLMAYSEAAGDEDWDTFADRLAEIRPNAEPINQTGLAATNNTHNQASDAQEPQPVAWEIWWKRLPEIRHLTHECPAPNPDLAVTPLYAAPVAGGAVSREAREVDILREGLERVRSAVSRSLDPHIWHIADGALRRALGGEKP